MYVIVWNTFKEYFGRRKNIKQMKIMKKQKQKKQNKKYGRKKQQQTYRRYQVAVINNKKMNKYKEIGRRKPEEKKKYE